MSGRKRIPDDERERIRDAFAAGMSCKEIGLQHGCSDKTVRRCVSEDPDAPRAMRRYREGSGGVDTTEIATRARLREVGLRPEPPDATCPECLGARTRDYGRGREPCRVCAGRGYLWPPQRGRRRA